MPFTQTIYIYVSKVVVDKQGETGKIRGDMLRDIRYANFVKVADAPSRITNRYIIIAELIT